jgi:hypothetical protein
VICYREVKPRILKFVQDKNVIDNVYEEPVGEQNPDVAENEVEYDMESAITDESDSEPVMETDTADDSPPALQDDSISDVEEILEFDLDEEWEVPMIYGHKTCETTIGRYEGTTFEAFGHQFTVTKVEQLTLGEVQQKWFKHHGLFSPREFQEVWKQQNKGAFNPEQKVWLHQFRRGFAEPEELPAFGDYPEETE